MDQKPDKPPTIGWNINVTKSDDRSRSRSPTDKKRKTSRTSSSTSSSSSDTASSSDNSDRRKVRHEKRKIKKEKKLLRKQEKREAKNVKREQKKIHKESKREQKKQHKEAKREHKLKKQSYSKMEVEDEEDCGVPIKLMNTNALIPETKEEYDKRQSQIRRVVDPETGRQRLIKGDGEILEEIVSRNRHLDINKKATAGDGQFFQNQTLGWNDLNK